HATIQGPLEDNDTIGEIATTRDNVYMLTDSALYVSDDRAENFSLRWAPDANLGIDSLVDVSADERAVVVLDAQGGIWMGDHRGGDFEKLDCAPCQRATAVLLDGDILYVARYGDAIYRLPLDSR
ncbi:MAG: hypothetical protein AAFN74_21220, partial [Myxococcota bacterium]